MIPGSSSAYLFHVIECLGLYLNNQMWMFENGNQITSHLMQIKSKERWKTTISHHTSDSTPSKIKVTLTFLPYIFHSWPQILRPLHLYGTFDNTGESLEWGKRGEFFRDRCLLTMKMRKGNSRIFFCSWNKASSLPTRNREFFQQWKSIYDRFFGPSVGNKKSKFPRPQKSWLRNPTEPLRGNSIVTKRALN